MLGGELLWVALHAWYEIQGVRALDLDPRQAHDPYITDNSLSDS